MWQYRLSFRKYSMHAKVVLSVSGVLIIVGTLLLKLTENVTWLGAFFHSVSARTAGFSTYPLGTFSNAGLLVLTALMFIGASPGSTGGGIKTSTLFVLIQGIKSAATNRSEKAFHNAIPKDAFRKASVITLLAVALVSAGTWLMAILEPGISLMDALFEVTSALWNSWTLNRHHNRSGCRSETAVDFYYVHRQTRTFDCGVTMVFQQRRTHQFPGGKYFYRMKENRYVWE